MRYPLLIAAAVVAALPTLAAAQTMPTSLPATAPAAVADAVPPASLLPTTAPATMPTSRPAPHVEEPPPGFIRVTAGRYAAFCLPVDEMWVRQSLAEVKPEHLPTTRPADILSNCAAQRGTICSGLAHDLDVDADTVGEQLFDQHLVPDLKSLQDVRPNVVFLVITEAKLIDLINNGWTHPRISYNRLMNLVKFNNMVQMRSDGVIDETLSLCEYETADTVRDRSKKLRDTAEQFESGVAFFVASRARVVVHSDIMQYVQEAAFATDRLRLDQIWLQLGVMTYEATQYAPLLTGVSAAQTSADLLYRPPNADPPIDSLDVLDLPPFNDMQPQYRQMYLDAIRVKASLAVQKLVHDGGPDAIRKALAAVKKNPPQDGVSMIALITGATGVDLYHDLRKQ